jgi:hypothetical protein
VIFWKSLSKLFYICLLLRKLINEKYFLVKENLNWFWGKRFFFLWKTLYKSCKKFKISCYLLIISNLILNLLFAIYFVLNLFFQFHPLKFDFYINFSPHFFSVIYFFSYSFLIEILYLSDLIFIFIFILFKIIYEIVFF